ncbi:ATP-binding protein [Streptomyces sp. ms191]|uniref:ATP-binding protein n=1 Tax=Streptomyces sp. ms191 TaxID=1827978 RepID=UPI0011CEADA4|nr:ATP-binding protein [Streptomyces sp. ms191]TXS26062.1 ATP-binding protein [Streptomyces sp. ms191]
MTTTIATEAPSATRHVVALPYGLHAPAVARHVTARRLAPTDAGPERVADAVQIVSELVTNAVRHSRGPCVLTLTVSGAALDIAVADRSEELPQLPGAAGSGTGDAGGTGRRTGGFGMAVIDGLGGTTTVVPALGGKTVHVRLDLGLGPAGLAGAPVLAHVAGRDLGRHHGLPPGPTPAREPGRGPGPDARTSPRRGVP